MTKLKEAKLKKMQEKVMQESHTKANLTPNKKQPNKPLEEKRSVKVMSNIRPSEKEAFIALIGRESESNVLRDLVLKFIERKGELQPSDSQNHKRTESLLRFS